LQIGLGRQLGRQLCRQTVLQANSLVVISRILSWAI
jgi:hypothetical protein